MKKIILINDDGSRDLQDYVPEIDNLFIEHPLMVFRGYGIERAIAGQMLPSVGTMGIIAADLMGTRGVLESVDARSVLTPADAADGVVIKDCITEVLRLDCGGDDRGCTGRCKSRMVIVTINTLQPGQCKLDIALSIEKDGQTDNIPPITISCDHDEGMVDNDVLIRMPPGAGTVLSVCNATHDLSCILHMMCAFSADAVACTLDNPENPLAKVVFGG